MSGYRLPSGGVVDRDRVLRFSWDDDPNSLFTQGNVNFNLYRSWLYAGRSFADLADLNQQCLVQRQGEGKSNSKTCSLTGLGVYVQRAT